MKKIALMMMMMVMAMGVSTINAAEGTAVTKKEQVVDVEQAWIKKQKALVEGIKQKGEVVGKSVTKDGMILTIENIYRDSYCMYTLCSLKKVDHTTLNRELNEGMYGEYCLQGVKVTLQQGENKLNRPNSMGQEILSCNERISTADTIYFVIKNRTTVPFKLEQEVKVEIGNVSYTIYQAGKDPQNETVISSKSIFDLQLTKEGKIIVKDNINRPVMYAGKKAANLKEIIVTPGQLLIYMKDICGILEMDAEDQVQLKMKDGTICKANEVGGVGSEIGDDVTKSSSKGIEKMIQFDFKQGMINVDDVTDVIINGESYAIR